MNFLLAILPIAVLIYVMTKQRSWPASEPLVLTRHAVMAGKTGLVIGLLHDRFIHVPIELLATQK